MAHLFICPNCGSRTTESDRTPGFRSQAEGCSNCGFGFLFELLDDYYPAPERGVLRLRPAGPDHRLRPRLASSSPASRTRRSSAARSREVLASTSRAATTTSATVLEWGVRQLGKPVQVNAEGDLPAKATADLFPAYDDDGGLLLVLTPTK